MGVIKQQSIKGTLFVYLGVLLGFFTTAVFFPRYLETDQIGLLRLLVSFSVLFSQFASLGFNTVTIRNFPFFRNPTTAHNGFLFISFLVNLIGFFLAIIVFYSIKDWLIESNNEKSALFVEYIYYLIPLIFFTTLFNLLDTFNRALYNAITGIVYKEILQRIFTLVSLLLFIFKAISFEQFVFLYIVSISLPALMILLHLYNKGALSLKKPTVKIDSSTQKEMASIAFFGMITSYSGVIIMNIDIVMINQMLGLSQAGIYTITFYFGSLVLLPSRSVVKIASVIIADGWKEKNINKIKSIYYKSNIILTILGLYATLGIILNLDNIIQLLGDNYVTGKFVIVFIALAHLFEMSTGVSQNVINNSKYFRVNAYLLIVFMILLVITNFLFIPSFGIIGAAFASALSRLIYNILSWLFLLIRFKLQPFNFKYIQLIMVCIAGFIPAYLIPVIGNLFFDILLRSLTFSIIFLFGIYFYRISDDLNQTLDKILDFVRNKK